jgi:hypothetical protein
VRRTWAPAPPWKRALRLEGAECQTCGARFDVPRRAATVEMYQESPDLARHSLLPPPPEVDLAELDRAMAACLRRRSSSR